MLVLTRPSLLRLLDTVTVAAITGTRRGSPTEIEVGVDEGLKKPSCANLCNVFTVRRSQLRTFVGSVSRQKMEQACLALMVACGCD